MHQTRLPRLALCLLALTAGSALADAKKAARGGRPLPGVPAPWQQKAPCREAEEALGGACYVEVAHKPPCPSAFYEHRGACFVAVVKPQRPDTSIGQ